MHNSSSSWDLNWTSSFGAFDNPTAAARRGYIPANFVPRQNPFYCALPYNDVTRGTTKPESRLCIPWFKDEFVREGQSVCRDRWIRNRNRSGKDCYAQWSDCGPFRTDHWQYVFGDERPKPNLNQGAALDVSPAVRDFLGLSMTDVTDWQFVEFKDVPRGPWSQYGEKPLRSGRSHLAQPRRGWRSRQPARGQSAGARCHHESALIAAIPRWISWGPCIVPATMAFTADEALTSFAAHA